MKCEQIRLLHSPLRHHCIHKKTARLLIVQCVVLDVSNYVLRLFALHKVADDSAREQWIFARILKVAAIPGLSRQIASASESHVEALRSKLLANHGAEFASGICIPACCSTQV